VSWARRDRQSESAALIVPPPSPPGDGSPDGMFMCFTLGLLDTPDIPSVPAECRRVLRPNGRIVVVAVSKEGKEGFMWHASGWTHRHFPTLMFCRPIYARRALEAAGFRIEESRSETMWAPVQIVRARK